MACRPIRQNTVHAGVSADHCPVTDNYVPAEGCPMPNTQCDPELHVVRDMRIRHQQVVIAD